MKNGKNIVLLFLIVILLGVIGFGYYYINKPDVVFTTALNRVHDSVTEKVKEFKQTKVDFDMSFNVEAGSEYKEYTDVINAFKIKSSMNYDTVSESFLLGLGVDYKGKSLISADMYYENEMAYIDLKDLFDKLIKVELPLETEEIDIKEEDIEVVVNEITNALSKTLKNGEYNTTKEDGITKNTLVINNKNVVKLINTFVDYLLNSNEFIESLSKITKEDKEYIIDTLNELKEIEVDDSENEIKISIYTKGINNSFYKLEIVNDKEVIITYTKEDDINSKVEMNLEDGKFIIEISDDVKNNKSTIKYSIEEQMLKATITMNMSYEYNKKLEKPNIQNSVPVEELTEEDVAKILEKLMENENISEFMEIIPTLQDEDIVVSPEVQY